MPLSPHALYQTAALALSVPPVEIGCGDCGARLDRFAEMELQGLAPAEALPLVEAHLHECHECRDEFEALMAVLRTAQAEGASGWRWPWRRGRS